MKLFLGTNILIDVIANRKPWVDEALVFSDSDIPVLSPSEFLDMIL